MTYSPKMGTLTPAPCTLLNAPYPLLDGVTSVREAKIDPQTTLDTEGPIRYTINRSENELILPSETLHEVTLSITRADGSPLDPDNDFVIPVNGIANAFAKSIETKVNGTIVSLNSTSTLFPYRCEIENRIFTDLEEKKSRLKSTGQYRSPSDTRYADMTGGELETMNKTAVADQRAEPMILRLAQKYKEGRQITLLTKLHDDLFNIQRLLPPGTTIDVALERSDPKFCLLTKQANPDARRFKVDIKKAQLYVTYVKLTDELMAAIMKTPLFIYQFDTVRLTYFSSSAAVSEITHNNVHTGHMPKYAIIGLLEDRAFSGAYDRDPFDFSPWDVRSVSITVNGGKTPSSTIETNFGAGRNESVVKAVNNLMTVSGVDSGIHVDNYSLGNVLYAFKLTPSSFLQECADSYTDQPYEGQMDIKIHLNSTPASPIITVVYLVTGNELRIHRSATGGNKVTVQAPEV